jgi:hypothetical protein
MMMKRTTFLPSAAPSWSKDELCQLRSMAQAGASVDAIATSLKRSISAIRNKAGLHGISLCVVKAPRPDHEEVR